MRARWPDDLSTVAKGQLVLNVSQAFAEARAAGRCAMIPYLTLGYPDLPGSLAVLEELESMECDAIEVGIPFSDPVADGPTIQHSIDVALRGGTTLRSCLTGLREREARRPRLLFSYLNPLLAYGVDELLNALPAAGVRAALVTDLIPEEAGSWLEATRSAAIETSFLATSTSSEERLRRAVEASSAFVYCVSTLGVTGARTGVDPRARELVDRLRELTDQPLAVGFGVSEPSHVREIAGWADGVVVGSALVRALDGVTGEVELRRRTRETLEPLMEATRS